ncbi:FtsX-like permease family protein [Paenibacillus montanisoli]|uniref:ABC transporter permease n=1 Tax=Paenibacillus montanisoli TaxID=2081970 RepID=A0A328TSX7_9BACL|nr:ABC transporter permease [Paenibacillus montanisoli]RAP73400.1 ABC transporter permease [Paenibacillus montanisoli]
MTFTHIVSKNLRYNFKRFLSYLFVNSFVVAVLFMYGSLLFNEILAKDIAMKLVSDYIEIAAYAIILFSIAFVSYTGIYFVKSRGKEFGVYLTLGMTTRDLMRMVIFESFVVVIGSAICGIAAGLLVSKLFYLILAKILGLTADIYFISYKTYLLSLGVFLFVFLCNLLFTSTFIRKLSIIQIAKASSTKGLAKSRPVIGGVAAVVFIASLWSFHATLTGNEWLNDLMGDDQSTWLLADMMAMFVSLYFAIASGIDAVRAIFARFPALYNRNILILSSLSHRFFTYKVSLYIVSLLIALSLFFTGFGLSIYSYTKKTIDEYVPFDFMIESTHGINVIGKNEIKAIVEANGGAVGTFSAFEYIRNENYRAFSGQFVYFNKASFIVSETNFNKHMNMSVDVAPDELLLVHNQKGEEQEKVDYDSLLTVEPWRAGNARAEAFRQNPTNADRFVKSLGDIARLKYEQPKTRTMYASFIDSYGNVEFESVMANVVDDSVYDSLRQEEHSTAYLFNLKSGDGSAIFAALLDALRDKNNDQSLWSTAQAQLGVKDQAEYLRPIYKAERIDVMLRINGFMFFSFAFMGLLFLMSSIVVLYYKIVTDVDEEKEKISLLKKIGLTGAECRSYLQAHLAILFFTPLVIGGIPVLFLLHASFGFTVYAGYLMARVLMLYGLFALMNTVFYLTLRKKFFRGAGLAA